MNENQFDQSIRLCPSLNQITSEYTSPCLLHSHKQWEFTIFLEGKYLNRINGKDYIAVANRVFILGPAHSHALTQLETKNRYRDIYIENKKLYDIVLMFFGKSLMRRLCNTENPICFDLSPQCLTELQPRLKALTSISRIDSDYNSQRQIADSIIVYLLGKLIEKDYIEKQPFPDWFLQVFTQLQEPKVFCRHISEIIEITNYSHSQFSMLFKKYINQSLVDFIGNIRLEYSLDLLGNENLSVLDIAYTIGYNSVSHYISKFKKKYGVTPLQYRKSKFPG